MNPRGYNKPQLGATFVPGGDDSYYMPEVISPAPQRVLAELPGGNMQDGLAHLEQQAQRTSPGPKHQSSFYNDTPPFNANQTGAVDSQDLHLPAPGSRAVQSAQPHEQPSFSPFPVLYNPPPNIPPTDDQKEASLESAREAVLASNDPETQLVWAQDALAYVEIAVQNEERISSTQPPRSRTPRIEHTLRDDAIKVVSFLADQHHPKAEFIRGTWLEFGKFGHRMDKREAFMCYTRASEKGYTRADYRIGMQFESSNDALKAIKYYQKGAEAGDSASCYRLGMMTLLGQHGQAQDYERGLNLIYQSAQTADENAAQGAYVFGMLQAGELQGVTVPERFLPRDIHQARINIEKAAYLGFAKAQVKMGSAYELCELGCEFDPALSLHYNALAARQGEAEAEMAISKWFLCGQEGVFEKNEEMAFTYAQRAAVAGLATAQFAMGYFYEVGIYVPVNFREAKEWYNRAAQSGNPDAGNRVEAISRSKTISRKDHERVAVSRIKQQHGSQAQQLPPLPPGPTIDMPDPSRLSLQPKPYIANRPPPVAPYPTEGPGPRPGLQSGNYSDFHIRPASAFGINPNLRPTSALIPPRSDSYGSLAPQSQQRPLSSADNMYDDYGRGERRASGPMPGPMPGSYPVAQGRVPPRPGTGSPSPNHQRRPSPSRQDQRPQSIAQADIGYSAPPNATADRRQRLHKPVDQKTDRPQPVNPGAGGPQARPYSRPAQPTQPSQNQVRPGDNRRPSAQTVQQTDNGRTRPNAAAAPAKPSVVASNTNLPGKGPKTFDDMGIPQGKSDSDCVLM